MALSHADELATMFARFQAWAEDQPADLTWVDFMAEEHARLIRQYPEMYVPTPDEDDDARTPDQVQR